MINNDNLKTKVQAVITLGEKVLETESKGFQKKTFVDEVKFHDFRISGLSFLSRVFGDSSQHYLSFKTEVTTPGTSRTKRGLGILLAAEKALADDWIKTTRGALTAELLGELMDSAKKHIETGNHYAAIIIMKEVIVKHLTNFCFANNIGLINEQQIKASPKSALQLTGEAYKRNLYDRQLNKNILSWIELYTKSAKDNRMEIQETEVESMHKGVLKFLESTPY